MALNLVDAPYALAPSDHEITVLPDHFDGETGVYTEAAMSVVKELRALGADDVAFLQPPDQRTYLGLRSHEVLIDLFVQIGSGVTSSFVIALFDRWLDKRQDHRAGFRVRVAESRENALGETVTRVFEADGNPDDVREALGEWEGRRELRE